MSHPAQRNDNFIPDDESKFGMVTTELNFIPETHVDLIGDQTLTLDDGSILTATGRRTWKNGVYAQLMADSTTGSGFQFYDSNAEKLNPGETVLLPDGQTITQEELYGSRSN
jgi:hypothetical protein